MLRSRQYVENCVFSPAIRSIDNRAIISKMGIELAGFTMKAKFFLLRGLLVWAFLFFLEAIASPVWGLPGQRTETVAAWIAGNPTLQPVNSDGLTVRRTDTAAQRFEFRASVFPPGRINFLANPGIIRSENFSLYDLINGVSIPRLEEALRVIYGLDIYSDYQNAQILRVYPSAQTLEMSRRLNLPGLRGREGQLRSGIRFAYWIELTITEDGSSHSGQMTIFLKEDLPKMMRELDL